MSYIGSDPDAIHRCRCSYTARNAQVDVAESAAQMASVCVPELWTYKHAIMVQETTNMPLTIRQADDVPLSGEEDEFLAENNRVNLVHSEVPKVSSCAMLR